MVLPALVLRLPVEVGDKDRATVLVHPFERFLINTYISVRAAVSRARRSKCNAALFTLAGGVITIYIKLADTGK